MRQLPEIVKAAEWVAVQWDENAPYVVLDRDGGVTERWTLPAAEGHAQLPIEGAAA